jgi:LysM repeat protein
MDDLVENNKWIKKIRVLTQGLIISGALNLGFLTTFTVMAVKNMHKKSLEPERLAQSSQKNAINLSLGSMELLSQYFELSYEALLEELLDPQLVEEGFAKRDYALGCLVSFHYFDIQKALSGVALQPRAIEFIHHEGGERAKIDLFAGLTDAHFEAIASFAKIEKWPLTSQGLFHQIKRFSELTKLPQSLKDAFFQTEIFLQFWRLFHHFSSSFSKEIVLAMMSAGDWDYIDSFYDHLCHEKSFSDYSVKEFLLYLIERKSPIAAKVLLEFDSDFALQKLDDHSILFLLSQLDKSITKPEAFARQLLVSVRSDYIHVAAGKKLYELFGEVEPFPYDHQKALIRFFPNYFQKPEIAKAPTLAQKDSASLKKIVKREYLVAKGDTIWKIALKHHVSVKDLLKENQLNSSSVIKPGMKLLIP